MVFGCVVLYHLSLCEPEVLSQENFYGKVEKEAAVFLLESLCLEDKSLFFWRLNKKESCKL